MTVLNEKEFIVKLYEEAYKLCIIAKTQIPRFKKEWERNFNNLPDIPPLIFHQYSVDKDKFVNNLEYRIEILEAILLSFKEGFDLIKILLDVLYNYYFKNSTHFRKTYNQSDQLVLKYLVAKEILGNIFQYNKLEHDTVPLKYNVLARNYYTMMNLINKEGQSDVDILESMKKINIKLEFDNFTLILDEIVEEGFLKETKLENDSYYTLISKLTLSEKAMLIYRQTIEPLVKWPILFWDDYFNIRELNVRVEGNENLNEILKRASTQGYLSSRFVFKGLIEYYGSNFKNTSLQSST